MGAPPGNLIALGAGGAVTVSLIGIFHFNRIFTNVIPYLAIAGLAWRWLQLIIMISSGYITNMLFVFCLLAVAAIALSLKVLAAGGILGFSLLTFFVVAKGESIGFDLRAAAITPTQVSLRQNQQR